MTHRILGPSGGRRRRRRLLVGLVASVSALGALMVPNAFAVHDYGVFQLEGNALTSAQSNPTASDDWDRVCHQVTVTDDILGLFPDQCTAPNPGNTTGATAVAFASEPNNNATIFTGGGSKDPQNISDWAWKDGAGGLPDKDNLLDAFAARYKVTGGVGDCPALTTCDVLYFGSDRLDNSGDAQEGFWFLQNACGLGSTKSGGGTNFVCTDPTPGTNPDDDFHRQGDLLVLSDFSNGGTTSTINIYKWVTSGGNAGEHLQFLAGGTGAKCDPGLDDDHFCGIVNPADGTTAPWSFTDKSGNHTFLNGEFFEAGVNLSSPQINLGGECFATLVSETRSSTSPTATLKDFIIGQFAQCKATLSTAPSATSVAPGTGVHDVATVTGNEPTKTPSGTVTFFMCSFTSGSTDVCDGTTGKVGVSIGTGELGGVGAIATATSPDVNCAADGAGCSTATGVNPLAPGHYCFRAEWPGDTNYTTALEFDGAAECFDVVVIPTQITTAQFFYPNDSATVSTSDGSDLPAGNVTFKLFGPAGGNTALENCTDNTATGLLYGPASSSVGGASGQSSGSASTSNTTVKMPNDVTSLYWRVAYTISPANPAYTGANSTCVENTVYTAGTSGNPDTATITNDPTPHG